MAMSVSSGAKVVALSLLCATVAACGLPRSGPNKSEIYRGSVLKQGDAFIVTVNARVTRATSVTPALGFSSAFQNAGVVGSDVISPGDVLGLTKLNYNACIYGDGVPVTLRFADSVGEILTAAPRKSEQIGRAHV